MSKYSLDDHYLDPVSNILRNRLGLTKQAELDQVEAAFVAARTIELSGMSDRFEGVVRFSLAHMQAIHRHLFGDVYGWAGELRTVDLAKGATRFANFGFIAREADKLVAGLEKENFLLGSDPKTFCDRAGYYMGEWNVLHPFRDGNGRTLREYVGQLAWRAGHVLRWDRVERTELVEASIAAYNGDHLPLSALLYRSLDSVGFPAAVIHRLSAGENPVRVYREHYDMTQDALGAQVGVTGTYIAAIERGARPLSKKLATKIASVFKVDADELEVWSQE
ncbi:Fic family protein [Thalassospira australica]|uniref:Fic family protein n=1 Tax=Thalassospira australica TaxID=1528106 RepID=UPI00068A2AF6|nr:Fic family protein [Thalassospira australica]